MRFLNALTLSLSAAAVGGCLFAVSCGNGVCEGAVPSASESWASSEDCMNGYSIVTDSSCLMGLVADGNSLVPIRPLYSELFFLTDDVLAGYGDRTLLWEDSSQLWAKVSDRSFRGAAADLGLLFRLWRFRIGAGVSTTAFRTADAEISVGFCF